MRPWLYKTLIVPSEVPVASTQFRQLIGYSEGNVLCSVCCNMQCYPFGGTACMTGLASVDAVTDNTRSNIYVLGNGWCSTFSNDAKAIDVKATCYLAGLLYAKTNHKGVRISAFAIRCALTRDNNALYVHTLTYFPNERPGFANGSTVILDAELRIVCSPVYRTTDG